MDFLKTLLAYVALTVAFSVQEGPLPQDVPTPTPLPPNVTASPIPNAPAATDVPTATPTASPIPEPTITPNMGYRTVQWQDRGSGVLKVQKKLIELGYLAEGEDDGAYGSKTTAAVRRFQKANGLSVDGIAGQATQTRLFEDPNVVPYSPPTVPPPSTANTACCPMISCRNLAGCLRNISDKKASPLWWGGFCALNPAPAPADTPLLPARRRSR